jgi:predicted amidohydrolase
VGLPQRLRVGLVQRAASLDPSENRAALKGLAGLAASSDLVVLPEASARDFGPPGSDLAPYAEPLDGPYAAALRELATEAVVVAGMFEAAPDADRPFNTLRVLGPGLDATYRKIHLYDSFGFRESDQLSAGEIAAAVVEVAGVPVGLMTCYDLRFPEIGRALSAAGALVQLVPAAWAAGPHKVEHWRTLLRARAIENVSYVVGVGQPGPRYTGHSLVVSPEGDVLVEAAEDEEVLSAELEPARVLEARERNPSLANRRM